MRAVEQLETLADVGQTDTAGDVSISVCFVAQLLPDLGQFVIRNPDTVVPYADLKMLGGFRHRQIYPTITSGGFDPVRESVFDQGL